MEWTEERIEALRSLWMQGLTASQIAERLGGVSRNAVIGKAHRLGLSARPSPIKREPGAKPVPMPRPARATPPQHHAEPAPLPAAPTPQQPPISAKAPGAAAGRFPLLRRALGAGPPLLHAALRRRLPQAPGRRGVRCTFLP